MRVIQPRSGGVLTLDDVRGALALPRGGGARGLVVPLVNGVDLSRLEPFAMLDAILGDSLDAELRLVVCAGWRELRLEGIQAARSPADGSLEVLFVAQGAVCGSALVRVAERHADGRPIALNVKVAALELLQAARDAFLWRPMEQVVRDAREALGLPAGPVTTLAAVRAARAPTGVSGAVTIDRLPELMRGPVRPAEAPKPAVPPPPAERHAIEHGRCIHCGKSDRGLLEACGRTDLGRVGLLELD